MNSTWKANDGCLSEIVYYTIPSFQSTKCVNHCFSTRIGGISEHPFNTLNLGVNTKDAIENIEGNYSIICNEIGIDKDKLVLCNQVHKDNILVLTEENSYPFTAIEIDAIITNVPNIPLVTSYADCVPIFMLDPIKKAIGLSHAGWRGTVKKIGKKTIDLMVKNYNSNPEDILIGIGPSIGQCCYEVDESTISMFKNSFYSIDSFVLKQKNNKFLLNLWEANKVTLIEAGIKDKNISLSGICTSCNNNIFFSYRGDNGNTGRMAAIIQLI